MASALQERVGALLAEARLGVACRAIATEAPLERRFAAGVYALVGAERALAATIDLRLLAGGDAQDAERIFAELPGGPAWYDFAAAAVASAWSGNAPAALRGWHTASEAEDPATTAYIGVATRQRLAHHALLFGELSTAQTACAEALALAVAHGLSGWRSVCAAVAATICLAAGDDAAAAELLAEHGRSGHAELRALFAPVGVRLALAAGDEASIGAWTSGDLVDVAENTFEPRSAAAAAMASLYAAGGNQHGSRNALILRRALLQSDGAAESPELYSLAARYGDADDAAFGVEGLRAILAPQRPYLRAHYLLARAHWCSRFGKRSDAIDGAGDAARAFDAMGLRSWTDEAMGLLVHDDSSDAAPQRRRPSALSLTGREQQVAHLIRRGASNREVARTLQISEHTVERHVSSILSRLGLRSRWQIVDLKNLAGD